MTIDSLIFDTRNVLTVVSFITFIGIVFWTYGMHRGSDFDTAAHLPFDDEEEFEHAEKRHG